MSGLIPYVVLAVVALGFFVVCYAVFNKPDDGESKPSEKHVEHKKRTLYEQEKVHITPKQKTHAEKTTNNSVVAASPITAPMDDNSVVSPVSHEPIVEQDIHTATVETSVETESTAVQAESMHVELVESVHTDNDEVKHTETESNVSEGTSMSSENDDTIALGESLDVMNETREMTIEGTQMIGSDDSVPAEPQGPSILEETRLFDADEINEHLANMVIEEEVEPSGPWAQSAQEDKRVAVAVEPFVHAFGIVHDDTLAYVQDITKDALTVLSITKMGEVHALMHNIVIQEALMAMQKAYAATPTPWMKTAALEAFLDVVQSPKSSTPYLVAFDALRILPHLTLGHFQVLALTLLLQYSRNSNNYGRIHFQHYVEKYIEPFISDLPHDPTFYRQLDYLRCTQVEREPITLTQLLSSSYPFVFNFRGFTKEELFRATDGHGVDPRFVVRSLNSKLYKLALVDEALAPRFFREARISNPTVQRDLLALMKSKPTAFRGAEAREIMDDISPVLSDLAKLYDASPMSSISLTLLGLYLGRAHVKATIGEEFDLSRWFS